MAYTSLLSLAGGIALLVIGANLLIDGASKLAVAIGLTPLVVGLTVVAYGTSAPEFAVSLVAGLNGRPDIAFGNVVGSNIANVLLVLGITAVVAPIPVAARVVRFDVPSMIAISLLLALVARDGRISRLDGALFVACAIAFTIFVVRQSRRESAAVRAEFSAEYGLERIPLRRAVLLAKIGGGLALLVFGGKLIVSGSVRIALSLGVNELVIGLTVVAIGTSLPEIAASIVAAARGERDIAVGNAVGSNIFNILLVLGLTALLAPRGLDLAPSALAFDLPVMVAVAVACLPIFFLGHRISRWEGALFVGYYACYLVFLVLNATTRTAELRQMNRVMLLFVFPLTAITLGVLLVRAIRAEQT